MSVDYRGRRKAWQVVDVVMAGDLNRRHDQLSASGELSSDQDPRADGPILAE